MTLAIVLGGAQCLREDMVAAEKLFKPDIIVAVKDIGITHPHVDHWVTYHPERLPRELPMRRKAGLPDPLFIWTYDGIKALPKVGIEYRKVSHRGGSSGFMGMVVACQVADFAVLCGIPMDPTQKHYKRPKKGGWPEAKFYRDTWMKYLPEFQGRVKSMSGWTQDVLGAPTKEWLDAATNRTPDAGPLQAGDAGGTGGTQEG